MRRIMPALAILAFTSLAAHAQMMQPPGPPPRLITMSGEGEVLAEPDRAEISIGVMTQDKQAKTALDANTAAMAKVVAGLKANGIADADIQTTNFSVNPRMAYDPQGVKPPKLDGYDVSNELRVTVRDLAKLGSLLDAAVGDGSNTVNGLSFVVSNTAELMQQARKKAMEDAQARAKTYAEAAGARLGQVVTISEDDRDAAPPIALKMARASADSAPVPVSPGRQSLRASVTAVWQLE